MYLLVAGPCWQDYRCWLYLSALWTPAKRKRKKTVGGLENKHTHKGQ